VIDFNNVNKDAKILVALSGGVDSSVALALLQEMGYKNVEAITLLLHENNEEKGVISRDQNVIPDTQKVAETLGIKVHYLDIKDKFNEEIISPFLTGYASGVTFNPCVKCNRVIKFGLMLDECKKMGFDILVTGHYIRWELSKAGNGSIYMGKSNIRDQSYFLSQVKQEALNPKKK
jgi:tRNA-uridine 2-sulfurtransferase